MAGRRDPRLQPGAYITNRQQLCEVLAVTPAGQVRLEDCCSGEVLCVGLFLFRGQWSLVKAAPAAPDFPAV